MLEYFFFFFIYLKTWAFSNINWLMLTVNFTMKFLQYSWLNHLTINMKIIIVYVFFDVSFGKMRRNFFFVFVDSFKRCFLFVNTQRNETYCRTGDEKRKPNEKWLIPVYRCCFFFSFTFVLLFFAPFDCPHWAQSSNKHWAYKRFEYSFGCTTMTTFYFAFEKYWPIAKKKKLKNPHRERKKETIGKNWALTEFYCLIVGFDPFSSHATGSNPLKMILICFSFEIFIRVLTRCVWQQNRTFFNGNTKNTFSEIIKKNFFFLSKTLIFFLKKKYSTWAIIELEMIWGVESMSANFHKTNINFFVFFFFWFVSISYVNKCWRRVTIRELTIRCQPIGINDFFLSLYVVILTERPHHCRCICMLFYYSLVYIIWPKW